MKTIKIEITVVMNDRGEITITLPNGELVSVNPREFSYDIYKELKEYFI